MTRTMHSLTEALTAFQIVRSHQIGDAVVAIGAEADFEPPVERRNIDFHRAWLSRAVDPFAITWCLRTLLDQLPKLYEGNEHPHGEKAEAVDQRLTCLLNIEPDPRISRTMVELLALRSPLTSSPDTQILMAKVLERHADDGSSAAIDAAGIVFPKYVTAPQLPVPLSLNAAELTRWRKWAPKPQRNLDALWAAALAAPEDDGAREVLSDALQEASDPRGEFIALQLKEERGRTSSAENQRASELCKLHGASWLGELRPIVKRAEFHRGMLSRIELSGSWSAPAKRWKNLAHSPLLQTVERIDTGDATGDLVSLFVNNAKNLKTVTVFDNATWASVPDKIRGLRCFEWKRRDARKCFRELVAPWLEARSGVSELGCEPDDLKVLSPKFRASLRTLECGSSVREAVQFWDKLPNCTSITIIDGVSKIELIRAAQPRVRITPNARVIAVPDDLGQLPKIFGHIEVVGNLALTKRLTTRYKKRFEFASVPNPSGLVTAVK